MSDEGLGQTVSEEITLNSRGYRLLKKLGEGSYAKVYLSEYMPVGASQASELSNLHLACKIVDTTKAPKDFVRKFFPRELDILVKLSHPHIVHVHSIFQRRSKYFIFMRYAENGDLLDFVLKSGIILESQARIWIRQMSLALQYMHELEIAHRDLKCENVLITANFNVKLADFGFSRYVIDSKGKKVLSETYCGSLSYAAPEILRGNPYNPKPSDIWSLGVILYVMLNKAMPFDDSNVRKLYEQQMSRKWKCRSKVENMISDQVKKLMQHTLEPDVMKRLTVSQILVSDWIAMDQRLLIMSPAEKMAICTAQQDKKTVPQEMSKTVVKKPEVKDHTPRKINKVQNDEMIVLKVPMPVNLQIFDQDSKYMTVTSTQSQIRSLLAFFLFASLFFHSLSL